MNYTTPTNIPWSDTDSWTPSVPWGVSVGMVLAAFLSNVAFGLTGTFIPPAFLHYFSLVLGFGNAIILHVSWQLIFLVLGDSNGTLLINSRKPANVSLKRV